MKGLKLSRKTRSLLAGFMGAVLFIGSMNLGAAAEEGNVIKRDVPNFVYASETDLGSAGGFAVFANDYSNMNHMEGTMAVRCFTPCGQGFGISKRIYEFASNASYYYYFESVNIGDNGRFVNFEKGGDAIGDPYPIVFPDNVEIKKVENAQTHQIVVDGREVSETINNVDENISPVIYHVSNLSETQKIDFDKAFDSLRLYSNEMKSAATDVTEISEHGEKKTIECKAGNNVVNLTYKEFTSYYWDVKAADGVDPEGYSLVINITDIEGDECVFEGNGKPNFSIEGERGGSDTFAPAKKVLFNFGNYNGHIIL